MNKIISYGPEILKAIYWDGRNGIKEKNTFPNEIKKDIKKRVKKYFKDYFQFKGDIPYNMFANLDGIYYKIQNEDEDGVIFIVAPPGFGKSSLGCTGAYFTDPTLKPWRVIFTLEQFQTFLKDASRQLRKEKEAILNGTDYESPLKNKTIVLDEGVYMLFSGDAMTKGGKMAQKLFSIIRALNLMVFVHVTNFRRVSKGVKEDRIIFLIKIDKKGIINGYSKSRIRQIKFFDHFIKWPTPNFTERAGYINPKCRFWNEYEHKKADFLFNATKEDDTGDA